MATQSFIMQVEEKVIDALDGLKVDLRVNDGIIPKENRDFWGTLMVNCKVLASAIEKALEEKNAIPS